MAKMPKSQPVPSVPGMSDADQAMEQMQQDPNGGMAMDQGQTPCIGTIVDVEEGKGGAIVHVHVDKEHSSQLTVGQQVELSTQDNQEGDVNDETAQPY